MFGKHIDYAGRASVGFSRTAHRHSLRRFVLRLAGA